MSHFQRSMPIVPAGCAGYEIEMIRSPAALKGANGIRIGPDGRLWICEAFAQRIVACDTRTGEIEVVIAQDSGALLAPDDLAFDSAGTLYITDAHRITVRRIDGSIFTLTDQLNSSNGITVDSDDRLYVNEFRPGGRLMEIDRATGNIRVIIESLDFPNACERGPDGRLYLQNVVAGIVFAVDVETGEREQIADGFQVVSAIKFDRANRLVLSEGMRGVVTRMDLATGEKLEVARMPLAGIDNIAFDTEGTLYVSSYTTGCVLKVREGADAAGEILVSPGLTNVSSVAPLGNDNFMIANLLSAVEVNADGSFADWSTWTASCMEDMVLGVWPIGADRALLLTYGGQVYRCGRGAYSYQVKAAAADPGQRHDILVATTGASALGGIDGEDGVLIGFAGGDIRCVDTDGMQRLVASTDQQSITALHQRGNVLVAADADAGTVVVVREGVATLLSDFARPTGVAIDTDAAAIFVAEHRARRIVRCDLVTGTREIIANNLPFGLAMPEPPPIGRASLLMQADGSLVVACDGDGSIRRLRRR